MADDLSDLSIFIDANEEISMLKEIQRPVHRAINLGKILCPNNHCTDNKEFFLENGIIHHFRVRHKQEFTSAERKESIIKSNNLHEMETRECMEVIFESRREKVIITTFICIFMSAEKIM